MGHLNVFYKYYILGCFECKTEQILCNWGRIVLRFGCNSIYCFFVYFSLAVVRLLVPDFQCNWWSKKTHL